MLDRLSQLPGDPIIELLMRANADPSPNVVDLSAGVFKDELGRTPIMEAVKQAEPRRLLNENTRTYQGIVGDSRFNQAIEKLIFGSDNPILQSGRLSSMQTVAGSAAVLMAGQVLSEAMNEPLVWAGKPTWANHYPLLQTAGVAIQEFPYYDSQTNQLLFTQMKAAIEQLPSGSVVLLHACCHNPSGADLSRKQWDEITQVIVQRELIPFVDAAYQGFGEGIEEDMYGLRLLASKVPEMLIAYSCSKNFAVYRDRIGALISLSKDPDSASRTLSTMMSRSRATYSMPAAHGAFIVAEILNDDVLTECWKKELATMRCRINDMRRDFSQAIKERGLGERFDFVANQYGMFSFLGISVEEVRQLREQYSVYMLESSRISLAGLTSENIPYVADSLASVL